MTTGKQLAPIDEIRGNLSKMEAQFKMVLPSHVSCEKFTRIAVTAIQNSPDLLSVDRGSLYSAVMKSAQDGLLPDGREAAIVKFGNQAAYMPMVGGILKKVRNSGELASLAAQIIYEKDAFRFWVDADGEHLTHEPLFFGDRGQKIGVYALAKTKDGAVYIEVLTAADVEAIRNVSRSKDRGPWASAFKEEMWKKSAIRRLSKRLPMSTDLSDVITADDEFVNLDPPKEPEPEKKVKSSRLSEAMKAHTQEAEIVSKPTAEEAGEQKTIEAIGDLPI